MLEDEYDSTRSRQIDRALLLAALVSFCFGCTAMLAGLIR